MGWRFERKGDLRVKRKYREDISHKLDHYYLLTMGLGTFTPYDGDPIINIDDCEFYLSDSVNEYYNVRVYYPENDAGIESFLFQCPMEWFEPMV